MRRITLGVMALAVVGATGAAFAAGEPFGRRGGDGDGPPWARFSLADREAFADARIAALHAGLKLNGDQEKLWPPVEDAIRTLTKVRREQRTARRERGPDAMTDDAPAMLRTMADAQTSRADALRKLADASQPLYATLDEGQKRRAMVLARPMHPHRGPGGWMHRQER